VWELFAPDVTADTHYNMRPQPRNWRGVQSRSLRPCFEFRPATRVTGASDIWRDVTGCTAAQWDRQHAPISIYEVHAGSGGDILTGTFTYRELADALIPYVRSKLTHIELMPISEHPLDQSWGYQTTATCADEPLQVRMTVHSSSPPRRRHGLILDCARAFPRDDFALRISMEPRLRT
jgi:1,4-alpha-glucan branching enzyme